MRLLGIYQTHLLGVSGNAKADAWVTMTGSSV